MATLTTINAIIIVVVVTVYTRHTHFSYAADASLLPQTNKQKDKTKKCNVSHVLIAFGGGVLVLSVLAHVCVCVYVCVTLMIKLLFNMCTMSLTVLLLRHKISDINSVLLDTNRHHRRQRIDGIEFVSTSSTTNRKRRRREEKNYENTYVRCK